MNKRQHKKMRRKALYKWLSDFEFYQLEGTMPYAPSTLNVMDAQKALDALYERIEANQKMSANHVFAIYNPKD